jgi:hypothetical protein
VLRFHFLGNSSTLNGVTVRHGYQVGTFQFEDDGGGIYNGGTTLTLNNVVVTNNSSSRGGGIRQRDPCPATTPALCHRYVMFGGGW